MPITPSAPSHLAGISSMATRVLLGELARIYAEQSGAAVTFESIGGVHAARRVERGEAFDLVVLASSMLASLAERGMVTAGTERAFAASPAAPAALAVKAGAYRPSIATPEALMQTLRSAGAIGYSTGPSGDALLALRERAGILAEVRPRLLQAPAGIPVADLIAQGRVELGLQQLSELADEGAGLRGLPARGRRERRTDHVAGNARRHEPGDQQDSPELLPGHHHRDDGGAVRRPSGKRMNPQLAGAEDIPGTCVFDLRASNRALRLNRFFWKMVTPEWRERFHADPDKLMEEAGLSQREMQLVRERNWLGLIQHGANFFAMEKFARVSRMSNLEVYASMRGESFEDFLKTRRVPDAR